MSSRRNFLRNSALGTAALLTAPAVSFANVREQNETIKTPAANYTNRKKKEIKMCLGK